MSKSQDFRELLQIAEAMGGASGATTSRSRERLLVSATKLFVERGYRRTSVEDIAKTAGLAKGTVYVHFDNKAELLFHAIMVEKRAFWDRARAILEAKLVTPTDRLRSYIRMVLASIPESPLLSRLLGGEQELHFALEELAPEFRSQLESLQDQGMETLLSGVGMLPRLSPAERSERARVLSGLLMNAASLVSGRFTKGLSSERVAELVARIVVDGVGSS